MSTSAAYLALSRRALSNTLRRPTASVPAILFPLLFMALTSAALGRSVEIPGFPPVDSFLQFLVVATIIQGSLFGAVASGADMATDIEGGFFDRLVASPVSRTSILVGRVAGATSMGFFQSWLYLTIVLLLGTPIEGGLAAMALISVTMAVFAAGVGGIAVAFALRTGSAEAVQGSFPMLFAFLFLSGAFFPRELMSGWFLDVASANPITYLVEGLRHLVIVGLDLREWLEATAVAAGTFVVGIALAGLALRSRLAAKD